MTFYYFINHIVKNNLIVDSKKISFLRTYIDQEIKTDRFNNNIILSNEIIKIYNRLYELYESKYVFNVRNISFYISEPNDKLIQNEFLFLQLVCESYFLEEHPIYLLNKLIKNPIKYRSHIIRLLEYNIFDEFITLKSYMKTKNKLFTKENKDINYNKNISYIIYLIHINNTNFKSFFTI
jgi:hypothetical protein